MTLFSSPCFRRHLALGAAGALALALPAGADPSGKKAVGDLPPASNPAAVDTTPGTGQLGRWLGLPADSPWRLGGAWVGNGTTQAANGNSAAAQQGLAQQLLLDLSLDLHRSIGWSGAKIWVQGLQVNASSGAADASGSIQGSNSLVSPPPLNRTELYSYAFSQDLFDRQVRIKIGKLVASNDFANVVTPDAGPQGWNYWIPGISSLTYTPLYAMPTLIGRLPGYPNAALGVSVKVQPKGLNNKVALQAGLFDGRGGSGVTPSVQTGLSAPSLGGPLFGIVQLGGSWSLGREQKPGTLAIGGWQQGGPLTICSQNPPGSCLNENTATGGYLIGQQRLINFRYPKDNSGITSFIQAGWTPAQTNLMTASLGGGLTMFAPLQSRPRDSYGLGLAWARINNQSFLANGFNGSELMLQLYGQLHITGNIYALPAITYLPSVGLASARPGSTNLMLQILAIF